MELDTPVQYIKGVGPKLSQLLSRKDIHCVRDVLQWFPRAYEDRKHAKNISMLQVGETVSFEATVVGYKKIPMGRTGRSIHELLFYDGSARIAGKWFRVPFKNYFESFRAGTKVRVTGEVRFYRHVKEIHHPEIKAIEDEEGNELGGEDVGLIPIYSETEGLNQKVIRRVVKNALGQTEGLIQETLPAWVRQKYKLPRLSEAFEKVHNPGEEPVNIWQDFGSPYQKRLIFEEFFWMELVLAQSRQGLIKEKGIPLGVKGSMATSIRKALPFSLTEGQEQVLASITQDLMKKHPMNRLVQGDVGCGKTVVAFLSACQALDNGFQVAMMAPTEILAEQHFKKAVDLFEPLGVKVEILSGRFTNKQAAEIKLRLASGEIDFIVGTHALIQQDVEFHQLGLAIIDEQHRFGVKQRAQLKRKGPSPHILIMTATPIPRTLAMTAYGDLDVSVIRELPKGRIPITTRHVFENKRDKVYGFVKEQLEKGRQAYVIYPLVEETEKLDLKNATEMAAVLAQELAPFKVGLLHGRLKGEEKDALMTDFKAHKLDVLVSTTVVEVGVDVPNANIMVIEHAERFGLAQLHQLRGRVGRGEHKSYCVLLSGHALGEVSKQRLAVMTQTNDGFKIAEEDLAIRGPGEFLGTRQSGLQGFKMANLVRDVEVLSQARDAAFEVIQKDPKLRNEDHKVIAEALRSEDKRLFTVG